MSDERRDDERDERPDEPGAYDEHAGEHELPPPATWAGRRRAADEPEPEAEPEPVAEADVEAEPEPVAEPEAADEEDLRSGFTEEFDSVERDLDEEAEVPEPSSSETVEADTLALADQEEAREAALAGLRARAAESGDWDAAEAAEEGGPEAEAEVEVEGVAEAEGEGADAEEAPADAGAEPAEPAVVAATAGAGEGEKPGRARPVWARFLAASLLIIASMAAATSISLLVYLTDIAEGLSDNERLKDLDRQLTAVDGGEPQTMLIIGSDERLDLPGDKRSDTTILLRVDPDKDRIALLSIPRDLRVSIPGHGIDKFNAAYSIGEAKLTLRVVKQLTGLDIQHVVNINFTGFADAVNAIDCVYIDVDREYYIPPESGTAEIDIDAGYQRMCGYKALQYVRFRHDDNDLVRSARQQDFLREARQTIDASRIIEDASYRNRLVDIFTEHTTSDIRDPVTMLELMRTFVGVANAHVEEVHFPADLGDGTSGYVNASDKAIQKAVDEFLATEGTPGGPPAGESPKKAKKKKKKKEKDGDGGGKKSGEIPETAMDDASEQGMLMAEQIEDAEKKNGETMIRFPIYYPTRLVPGSILNDDSRAFPIDGPGKEKYWGYKLVAEVPGHSFGNGLLKEYYGISGTNWMDPPILESPSEERKIDGRTYQLFYDGDRLRLVAFKTDKAVYWVNNTLSQSLSEAQMLSIATSMRSLD